MKRREFIAKVGVGAAATYIVGGLSIKAAPLVKAAKRVPTIAEILTVSWDSALKEMLRGNKFADPRLNAALAEGRIRVVTIGAAVQLAGRPEYYKVEQLAVPLTWAKTDDEKNDAKGRITLVTNLIENGVNSHDFMLLEQLEKSDLVVSKQYCYERSEIQQIRNQPAYYTMIYTAFAAIPKGALNGR